MAIEERFEGANAVDAGRLSPYWGEHAARYHFARPYLVGRIVLDIACGTGYGLAIMSSGARSVIGIDLDPDSVRQALASAAENVGVAIANGIWLPFDDDIFDVVTSFETIEHINDRPGFLAELRRIIKPGGHLILSTPNALYTKPVNGKPNNPFHIYEYTPKEFRSEVSPFFDIEQAVGQDLKNRGDIPPFYEAQRRLAKDPLTQTRLFTWKAFNKLPFDLRESLSNAIWKKPFYPTEHDYTFRESDLATAPTQLLVCRK